MATLSPLRQSVGLLRELPLIHRGKIRDTYDLGNDRLLLVASDGISIFDFVLNALVPDKGAVLTALSHFWFSLLEKEGIRHHVCAVGADIDEYLPLALQENADLRARAFVVRKLTMRPVEFIARNYLTGSAYLEYQKTGMVAGTTLSTKMNDGDMLSYALFTPTDKASDGHDAPISPDVVWRSCKIETATFLRAFTKFTEHARSRGIIVADTKGELGVDKDGHVYLADEFGTPDSSRFWLDRAWKESRTRSPVKPPPPFDKQLVREWGITQGINKRNPLVPEDIVYVHGIEVPAELLVKTSEVYKHIFTLLTGVSLNEYQQSVLNVRTS